MQILISLCFSQRTTSADYPQLTLQEDKTNKISVTTGHLWQYALSCVFGGVRTPREIYLLHTSLLMSEFNISAIGQKPDPTRGLVALSLKGRHQEYKL